jgi:hypothetical protein
MKDANLAIAICRDLISGTPVEEIDDTNIDVFISKAFKFCDQLLARIDADQEWKEIQRERQMRAMKAQEQAQASQQPPVQKPEEKPEEVK